MVVLSFAARAIAGGGVVDPMGKEVCGAGTLLVSLASRNEELQKAFAEMSAFTSF
jgi:hypothetical protein